MELTLTPVEHLEVKLQTIFKHPSADASKFISSVAKVYRLETKHDKEELNQSPSKGKLVTNSIIDMLKELNVKDNFEDISYLSVIIKDKITEKEQLIEFEARGGDFMIGQWDNLIEYILQDFNVSKQ